MRSRTFAPVAVSVALMLAASACSSNGSSGGNESPAPSAPSGSALSLKGICPDNVVIQTDWFAESEYANLYQMLGPNPTFDRKKKRMTGSLVSSGKDTGVKLEIRYGGPAIGYQQVSPQMYQDKSILLGQVSTDEAVQNSAKQPTLAVLAPLEVSPIMIMWDKDKHPEFNSIADIGQTDTKVVYYQTDTYMQYLLGAGILRQSQVDGSYDGGPSRWVASGGTIAQGGFATSEPYIYKHELGGGKSYNVDLQLINDTNYPLYGQAIVIRSADKEKQAPCLKKLVPIMQQATVDFITNPGPTNKLVIDAVQADKSDVWNYSPGMADFAVKTMKDKGLVSNGTNATLGDFDDARVKRMIEILTPIFASQHKPVKEGLKPSDLYTNEFIDPKIGLKSGAGG
jgi:hypothetical protein